MKNRLILVCMIVIMLFAAYDTHAEKVSVQGGTVDRDSQVGNPESMGADAIDPQGGTLAKTFHAPATATFRTFNDQEKQNEAPEQKIDLVTSEGWSKNNVNEGSNAIGVSLTTQDVENANQFPMSADGNLSAGEGVAGGVGLGIHWSAMVANLIVQITDAADTVLTDDQVTVVGKKITLKGKVMPAGTAVTAHNWTIGGIPVKNYEISEGYSTGTKSNLQASDLDKDSVTFYWIDENLGSTKIEVRYEATIDGKVYAATVKYEVKRPTATMTSTTTTHTPPVNVGPTGNPGGGEGFQFGTLLDPGITWNAQVTTPTGGAGTIGFVQLVNTVRRQTLDDTTSTKEIFTTNQTWVLDTHFPYGEITKSIGDNATELHTASDTPGTGLSGKKKVSADDKFIVYLMYKPAGDDSIWVSLRRISWFWKGSATKGAGGWAMDPGQSSSNDPGSTDTTLLPEWTQNVTDLLLLPDNP